MPETVRPLLRTLALGALLVGCGGLLDAEPLYVPGLVCLVLAVGAAAWVLLGARGVRIGRSLGARRVVEDEPVGVELRVVARRRLPTGALLDPLLPSPTPLAAGRHETRVRFEVRFGRRGRKALGTPRVAVRDPFGLMTRHVRGTDLPPEEILVLPRIEPVRAPGGDGESGTPVLSSRRSSVAAEIELDGLRQHRLGTPASRIYWPSLAKGGDLLERRLRADSDTRPLVVLDPRAAASEDDLDAAVRAAASLAVHLAHAGGSALLVPGDRRPTGLDPGLLGWAHLHARLALVDGASAPSLAGMSVRRGPILYVAARRLTRPPRAIAQAPGGGRMLVVPGSIAGRRAAFVVAGCTGYEVSSARRATPEAVA